MNKKDTPIKCCENCIHKNLLATSEICRDCWNYQRWKNFEPEQRRERMF